MGFVADILHLLKGASFSATGFDDITIVGGRIPVTATVDTSALATSGKQDTGNAAVVAMNGKLSDDTEGRLQVTLASAAASGTVAPAKANWIGAREASTGYLLGLAYGQQAMAQSLPIVLASDSPFALANKPPTAPTFPAQVTVGGAGGVVATAFAAQACNIGLWIQADHDNTASVYIGTSDVAATKGWRLKAGEVVMVETTQASGIYHISTTTGQKVNLRAI
jgi:hypothetical protein